MNEKASTLTILLQITHEAINAHLFAVSELVRSVLLTSHLRAALRFYFLWYGLYGSAVYLMAAVLQQQPCQPPLFHHPCTIHGTDSSGCHGVYNCQVVGAWGNCQVYSGCME